MIDIAKTLASALTTQDQHRPRSQQKSVGPSSIGGCARQVWHIYNQTEITNHTDNLPAIMGTAIHAAIAEAMQLEDPWGENFLIETTVNALGRTGHVDLFVKDAGLVVDWKTTKLKSMRYFPNDQQRIQVQTYGLLMEESGYTVNEVALVAIARDGEMKDIKVHREPYNKNIGLSGLKWLEGIESSTVKPAPEKSVKTFCAKYCNFYDPSGEIGCPGL